MLVCRPFVPVRRLEPPPSTDCCVSTMLTVVLPLGRLTLVVVTVVAIAEPAARPNRMPETATTDLNVKPIDRAIVLIPAFFDALRRCPLIYAGCVPIPQETDFIGYCFV